jgi:hypothetical protein
MVSSKIAGRGYPGMVGGGIPIWDTIGMLECNIPDRDSLGCCGT